MSINNALSNEPKNRVWNTALYIRLSREDGDKMESDSVKSQRDMLRDFLSKNPDLKYYDDELGKKYSKVDKYFEIAVKAIKIYWL